MWKKKIRIIDILKTLEENKIKYVVVGGIAVVIYGYERFTKDIDLIIDFSKQNIKKFIQIMKDLGFVPRVPENPEDLISEKTRKKWIKEKGAKVFTFIHPKIPFISVDILLNYNYKNVKKKKKKLGDITIRVIALDELLEMKKKTGRLQDMVDIEKLSRFYNEKETL